MRLPNYIVITVLLTALLMLVASFALAGRNFEMVLLREGFISANRLPPDAQLGDLFYIKGSKFTLVKLNLVCNNFKDLLQSNKEELIESRSRPNYLENTELVQAAVKYLDKSPNEIVATDHFFKTQVLKVGEFVTATFDSNPGCEESFKPGCYLAYASDAYIMGERIAFATSSHCQLFRYEEMSNEEIDKLTSEIDILKLFHVPFPYRISLKISNALKRI